MGGCFLHNKLHLILKVLILIDMTGIRPEILDMQDYHPGKESVSDEQLTDRIVRGDPSSLDELYRRYAKQLYVFFRNGIPFADAEDCVHDVFIKVIESIQRFDANKASFRTWLFSIARNYSIDLMRRKSRSRVTRFRNKPEEKNPDDTIKEQMSDDSPSFEDKIIQVETVRAVRECIDTLNNIEEKQAIILYYFIDQVYREIAAVFNCSISLVKKRILSAREKVRICLKQKGILEAK